MVRMLALLAFISLSSGVFAQDIESDVPLPWFVALKLVITSQWTQTGLGIQAGDTVIIMADGIASTEGANSAPRQFEWVGPEGRGQSIAAAWFPMPGVPEQCVLGKIGSDGTPFYIGRGLGFKATKSGTLHLGYNDTDFSQNYGTYILYVIRYRPTVGWVAVQSSPELPLRTALDQNYPNPFNPSTVIRYVLPVRSHVTITVHNTLGQTVRAIVNEDVDAGNHEVQFDAGGLASGVYLYRMSVTPSAGRDLVPTTGRDGTAGNFVETKKLILLR
jgi:hypothetical protein